MPTALPRTCTTPRCPGTAARGGKCASCARDRESERNQRRPLSLAVYRSARWRALRRRHLDGNPWCQHERCPLPATEVDHVIRIEAGGDPWSEDNLQSLCHDHHSEKTAHETGFGGRHD